MPMRLRRRIVAALTLTISACADADNADIVALCSNTIGAYAHARDNVDVSAMRPLFTLDATFEVFGNRTHGRELILENMAARASAKTHHLVTSINIDALPPSRATGNSYALVFELDEQTKSDELFALVLYEDQFAITNETCQFASRSLSVTPINPKTKQ